MLHGAQDRAAQSGDLNSGRLPSREEDAKRYVEEKHYAGALRGGTQGPEGCETSAPQITDRLARNLSYIHKTQQETLGTLHELHSRLLGPVPPMPSSDPRKTASNAGLFNELHDTLTVLQDNATMINSLSAVILRAI